MKILLFCLLLMTPLAAQEAQPSVVVEASDPPGHNVHRVVLKEGAVMWRGGSPTRETLRALQATARKTGRPVTFIDLRHPPFDDDLRGGGGRLTPAGEEKAARELGLRYRSISALDRDLIEVLAQALRDGHVYVHCQYGVNRTGFAVGRYATAGKLKVDRTKLGERDWNQGVNFQNNIKY